MTQQPEESKPFPPERPKRRRPSYREKIRQRNRCERDAAIDRAEAEKRKPPKDALERAVKGTVLEGALRVGSPLMDPLFMEAWALADRNRIMREVEDWETRGPFWFGPNCITIKGETLRFQDFIEWQSKMSYELLKRNADPRSIAALVHRPVDWVENVAERFNIISNARL